jgi:hypothetical protein
VVNQPGEECDAGDDAACEFSCRLDCTCGPPTVVIAPAADVSVQLASPTENFGARKEIWADADTAKQTFFRFTVTGVGNHQVLGAVLYLTVDNEMSAGSDSGGRLHAITNCGWDELTMTWPTRPFINGPLLDFRGGVQSGEVVDFDVDGVVTGDGTYCFGLYSGSADGVTYHSRESSRGQPVLVISLGEEIMPVCGDGAVNQPTEACDGADDALCPGVCGIDCLCPNATCGDNTINQPGEECDGLDDAACPGVCEPDCECPAPPACGDDDINQAEEECDGTDAPGCPGRCQVDCTCPPPACGDGHVNRPREECDGLDAAACPGACRTDCTCDAGLPVAIVEADVSVHATDPLSNFSAAPFLWADLNTEKLTYFRVRVRGVDPAPVLGASLRLQVADDSGAPSDSGGRLHHISDCGWDERAMTYETRPVIDGLLLDEVGAVDDDEVVEFDVSAAVTGDGTYCFALDSLSSDGVEYASREALIGRPMLEVVTFGVCGDDRLNHGAEECDGTDDWACPAACLEDCTCAVCGDGLAAMPIESCDGADDAACSGQCGIDCSCPFSPPPPFACLRGGADITLRGVLLDAYQNDDLAPGTKIDARAATVLAFPDNAHPINLEGGSGSCFSGGTVLGQYDRTLSWEQMHDVFHNAGIAFTNASFTVDGLRVDNVTDGLRPRNGGNFTVRNTWLSYIRDDCLENDHLHGGLIEDSLFDGCYVGISTRPSDANIAAGFNGSDKVLTIRNTLVRLEPMPGPPGGSPTELGHGGFFKWHLWNSPEQSLSPKLALYDNVFMAEQARAGEDRMGTPPGQVLDCANNVMVWLGPGAFPDPLPACFTVTTDRSVWDTAVADWHARHPHVGK